MMRQLPIALLGASTFLSAAAAPAQTVTLRIATQAPEGTVWMDAMNDIKREVEKRSKGRVKLQLFPNGSQGDEKAVIDRMGLGLLHGGLFTGIGLGEVLPAVRILELPFVYRNKEELDAVKAALEPDFKAGFQAKGMVLLGWSEVGWAYIFSKNEARDLDGLRKRKIWRWSGDPLAEKVFQTFEMSGIPLALTDVLTSLETGVIDSVYNSPYGLVGLQWHRDLKYMSRMTVGHGTGALLVADSEWQKIPPAIRDGIAKLCRERLDQLLVQVKQKNEETVVELEKNGMQVIPIPEAEFPRYVELGEKVADQMAGVLYDKAMLERARKVLAEKRQAKGN